MNMTLVLSKRKVHLLILECIFCTVPATMMSSTVALSTVTVLLSPMALSPYHLVKWWCPVRRIPTSLLPLLLLIPATPSLTLPPLSQPLPRRSPTHLAIRVTWQIPRNPISETSLRSGQTYSSTQSTTHTLRWHL